MARRRVLRPDSAFRASFGVRFGPAGTRMRLRGGSGKCIIGIFIQVGEKWVLPTGRRAAESRLSTPAGRCGAGLGEPRGGELDILGRFAFFSRISGKSEEPEPGPVPDFGGVWG